MTKLSCKRKPRPDTSKGIENSENGFHILYKLISRAFLKQKFSGVLI